MAKPSNEYVLHQVANIPRDASFSLTAAKRFSPHFIHTLTRMKALPATTISRKIKIAKYFMFIDIKMIRCLSVKYPSLSPSVWVPVFVCVTVLRIKNTLQSCACLTRSKSQYP